MKIVPYFALGQFSPRNLVTSAILLPLAVVTNFLGIWLVTKTPTERFYRIAYLLMLLIAVALLVAGVARVALTASEPQPASVAPGSLPSSEVFHPYSPFAIFGRLLSANERRR